VGVLERLGIGRPPWEREEEEAYYTPAARPENQLGTGFPSALLLRPLNPLKNAGVRTNGKKNPCVPLPHRKNGPKLVIMRKNTRKKKITGEKLAQNAQKAFLVLSTTIRR